MFEALVFARAQLRPSPQGRGNPRGPEYYSRLRVSTGKGKISNGLLRCGSMCQKVPLIREQRAMAARAPEARSRPENVLACGWTCNYTYLDDGS